MASLPVPDIATRLSRVPPWFQETISERGAWKFCALERSCFGPMDDPTPAAPFHHLGVRLDYAPVKMGWVLDGHRTETNLPGDHVSIIPAGASLRSWWNRPVDFACLYFTPAALAAAVGEERASASHFEIRPALAVQSPAIASLVRALNDDAAAGHPWGAMRGDAIFVALAALLAHDGRILHDRHYRQGIADPRVRRALEFIHTHLAEPIDLFAIAAASGTSPFHLSRIFRKALGCAPWQYVSRQRTQLATGLMQDPTLTLAQIAAMSGFESYSSFAAIFKTIHRVSPTYFRSQL